MAINIYRQSILLFQSVIRKSYPGWSGAFPYLFQFLFQNMYTYLIFFRFMIDTFERALPCERTIKSWYNSVEGNPGFCEEVFRKDVKKIYAIFIFFLLGGG